MKFEEAFKEMEKGKIAMYGSSEYRVRIGKLQFKSTFNGNWVQEWINNTFTKMMLSEIWKIKKGESLSDKIMYFDEGRYLHVKDVKEVLLKIIDFIPLSTASLSYQSGIEDMKKQIKLEFGDKLIER